MRLISTTGTQKTVDPTIDPTGGQTLDALMARQKALMEQAAQPMPAQIASPWQGAALMAQGLSNSLQQNQVMHQEQAGRQALAAAMQRADPITGELPPDAMATVTALAPEMGYKFIADSMANRRAIQMHQLEREQHLADVQESERFQTANQETWKQDPTDPTKYVSSRGNVEYKQPQAPRPNWTPDPNNPGQYIDTTQQNAPQAAPKPDPHWVEDPEHPGQYIDTTKQSAPQGAPKPPPNWVPDPRDPSGHTWMDTTHQNEPKIVTDPNQAQALNRTVQLKQEYQNNQVVKNYNVIKNSVDNMKSSIAENTGAGDIAALTMYMKMIDPTSSVHESEMANAQNAAGVPDKIREWYNQALTGTRLVGNVRDEFLSNAYNFHENAANQVRNFNKSFANTSIGTGVDPRLVVDEPTDYSKEAANLKPLPLPAGISEEMIAQTMAEPTNKGMSRNDIIRAYNNQRGGK
jgi:hypothetical protein